MSKNKARQKAKLQKNENLDKPYILGAGWLLFICVVIWLIVIMNNYLPHHKLPPIGRIFSIPPHSLQQPGAVAMAWVGHLLAIVKTCIFFFAAFGAGKTVGLLLKHTKFGVSKKIGVFLSSQPLASTGIGLGILVFAGAALGVIGKFLLPWLWFVVVLFGCAGITLPKPLPKTRQFYSIWKRPFFLLTGGALLVSLVGSLAPETFYDTLFYQLGIPQYWLHRGYVKTVPYVMQSLYPQNMGILYGYGLALGRESVTKLMNFGFGVLTILVMLKTIKTITAGIKVGEKDENAPRNDTGMVAAAIFTTIPTVMYVWWHSGYEMALAFFEMLALWCVASWFRRDEIASPAARNDNRSDKSDRYSKDNYGLLVLAGIFVGLAVGTKYTSLMAVAALSGGILVVGIIRKENLRKVLLNAVMPGIIALVVASPWLIRAFVSTGNPVFPFFFGTGHYPTLRHFSFTDPALPPFSILNYILFPWKLTIVPDWGQANHIGMTLLFLTPLVFLLRKKPPVVKFLLTYCIMYTIAWLAIGRFYFRYLVPFIPALALLLCYAIAHIRSALARNTALVGTGILCLLSLIEAGGIQKMALDPLGVVLGVQSKEEYLSTARMTYPSPYYPAAKWMNENLSENSCMLVFGEQRPFYIDRPFVFNCLNDYTPLMEWLKESKGSQEFAERLHNEGITHLFVNLPELYRLKGILKWDKNGIEKFSKFWDKYIELVWSSETGHLRVYRIFSGSRHEETYTRPGCPLFSVELKWRIDEALDLYRKGMYADAAVPLERVCLIDKENAGAWHLLAICYEKTGRQGDAVQAIEKAYRIAPENKQIRYNRRQIISRNK